METVTCHHVGKNVKRARMHVYMDVCMYVCMYVMCDIPSRLEQLRFFIP